MSRPRLGGWLGVGVSLLLLGVVFVRGVGLNVLNGWTIVVGAAAGLLTVAPRRPALVVDFALVLLAMLPALFGGLGLLYLPSLILICPLPSRRPVADQRPLRPQ